MNGMNTKGCGGCEEDMLYGRNYMDGFGRGDGIEFGQYGEHTAGGYGLGAGVYAYGYVGRETKVGSGKGKEVNNEQRAG